MAIHAIAVREAPRENGSLILDFEQRVGEGGGGKLNPKLSKNLLRIFFFSLSLDFSTKWVGGAKLKHFMNFFQLKGIPKLKTNFLPQNHLTIIRCVVFAEFFFYQFFTHF